MSILRRICALFFILFVTLPFAHANQDAVDVDTALRKLKISKDVYICPMEGHKQEFSKPGVCPICGMPLQKEYPRLHVAVLVFDGVEEIDYAGPIEVFGYIGADVFTVAANTDTVRSAYDVQIKPDYDLAHAPASDVIVVPGGTIENAYKDARLLEWLRQRSAGADIVMSVCNGAFILGEAGLLDGLTATTTAGATADLARLFPKVHTVGDRRYVDNGKIITTAGLTSGIDGALHVIDREHDRLHAEQAARYMEYDWHPNGESDFGIRAQFHEPSLAKILPDDASWQYLSNHGDAKHWEITGHLESDKDPEVLLDSASAQLKKDGWSVHGRAKMLRTFQKTANDGKWQLTLMLINEANLAVYHMSMAVQKTPVRRNSVALH